MCVRARRVCNKIITLPRSRAARARAAHDCIPGIINRKIAREHDVSRAAGLPGVYNLCGHTHMYIMIHVRARALFRASIEKRSFVEQLGRPDVVVASRPVAFESSIQRAVIKLCKICCTCAYARDQIAHACTACVHYIQSRYRHIGVRVRCYFFSWISLFNVESVD